MNAWKQLRILPLLLWEMNFSLGAQTPVADSLRRLLAAHPERDSLRCEWLYQLGQQMMSGTMADMIACGVELVDVARHIRSPLYTMRGYNFQGIAYSREGIDLGRSLEAYQKALQIARGQTGAIWRKREGQLTINVAGTYLELGNLALALDFSRRALRIFQNSRDSLAWADNYKSIALVLLEKKQLDSALTYFQLAGHLYETLGKKSKVASQYCAVASVYALQKKYEQAVGLCRQCLAGADSAGNPSQHLEALMSTGVAYLNFKKWHLAQGYLYRALSNARHLGYAKWEEDVCGKIADLYEQTGRSDSALFYYKKYAELRQTRMQAQADKKVYEMEALFRLSEKERENTLLRSEKQLLERDKQLTFFVGLSVLLGLLVLGYFLRRGYLRRMRENAEELRGFNYSVGHDLRAPVQNARQWIEHLRADIRQGRGGEVEKDLTHVEQSLDRLKEMLEGMVRWFSLEDSRPVLSEVNVRQLVEDLWQEQRRPAKAANVQLRVGELPTLRADKLMLRQIFDNLLRNAVKFSKETAEPLVEVSCTEQAAFWQFEVHDNGVGFDAAQQKSLFQLFKTLHTRDRFPGLGLGLAIVKRLVEKQGGTVGAESAGAGMGATIYFTLPK